MIYIMHAIEDTKIALQISLRMEEAGFTTFVRLPDETKRNEEELLGAKAVILLVSPFSILSFDTFQNETKLLKQSKASLLPLLYGMSRAEFDTKQTEWKSVIGASATVQVHDYTVGDIIPKLVTALKGLGEKQNPQLDVKKISDIHSRLSGLDKEHARTVLPGAHAVTAETRKRKVSPVVASLIGITLMALVVVGYYRTLPAAVEEKIVLRLHGSNTIGAVLGPALAEAFVKKIGGGNLQWKSGSQSHEKKIVFSYPDSTDTYAIEIFAHGSSYSFRDLTDKKCDVGMASRQIKNDEAVRLKVLGSGDMFSSTNEHVLAIDGLAIIVHPSNPLRSLTIEQVAEIFSGTIANWKTLNGMDATIRLYARDSMSGTAETFHQLVLHRYKVEKISPDASLFEDSNELSHAVANDPNGIGFVSFTYANEAKLVAIAEENGSVALFPNFLTVGREDYSLSRRLYLYTATNPANDLARKFVNFALSEEGQKVVEENKFVDLSIRSEQNPLPQEKAPATYSDFVKNAKRLSVNFRFQIGKDNLDTKAAADLERIVSFVKENGSPRLKLIGFSDDEGDGGVNFQLSLARAQHIEKEFRERGINIAPENVVGFGKEMPIASNETSDGKRKNRRVEVWIE